MLRECTSRYVVAHFMVGNTYPHTREDWIVDIQLASTHGFDGFALNVGREDWQRARVADCYAAAQQLQTRFKLFLSFDMSSVPGATADDADFLSRYLELVASHPNQLLYTGEVLVSTFAGGNLCFGQSSAEESWTFVKKRLSRIAPIHFIPAFFIDPATYPFLSPIDGIFHWNGGWPLHLSRSSPSEEICCPKLDTDKHHLAHLGRRTYMAAISPWFFTHYGPNSWNKNWIYRGDDWLVVRRWEYILHNRSKIDIVQLISWNDYGESHYIAPPRGAQPNSQAWADGFPHDPWLVLNAYFIRAFKEGRMPRVEKDRIFMWARPHPKAAEATEDDVGRPTGWELTDDVFWVVVFSTAPATIILDTGAQMPSNPGIHDVGAGVTKLAHKLVAGGGMRGQIIRGGTVVAECAPSPEGYKFEARPRTYNFNAYVAMSP